MKRWQKMLVLIGLAAIFLGVSGYGVSRLISKYKQEQAALTVQKTKEEAAIINANSYFGGLKYLRAPTRSDFTMENFRYDGPYPAEINNRDICGYYFPYPDKDRELFLTQISISGGTYHLFDIKIGNDVDEGVRILEQKGYKETKPISYRPGEITRSFKKYDAIIELTIDESSKKINRILVTADIHKKWSRGMRP